MAAADRLESCTGFDWDEASLRKNWDRHGVTPEEAEDVFFQEPLIIRSDLHHLKSEKRYYALGQTAAGRRLFAAFTIRGDLIRVISARDMNRNEGKLYARCEKENNS
ncbi:MAG TPA: BrnT family toxin [Bryobacteraceae bacterium]|nr:BrnT family toxin [Bryobacteraceae bacterium]